MLDTLPTWAGWTNWANQWTLHLNWMTEQKYKFQTQSSQAVQLLVRIRNLLENFHQERADAASIHWLESGSSFWDTTFRPHVGILKEHSSHEILFSQCRDEWKALEGHLGGTTRTSAGDLSLMTEVTSVCFWTSKFSWKGHVWSTWGQTGCTSYWTGFLWLHSVEKLRSYFSLMNESLTVRHDLRFEIRRMAVLCLYSSVAACL